MNGAHLHLLLSHVAPIGGFFTLLLFIFALIQKNKELKRTALWFTFFTGISALVTFMTGDSAEEIVKKIPGISDTQIEFHEMMAMFYLISLIVVGVMAVVGLFLSRASTSVLHKFTVIVFILLLLTSYLAVMTSLTGGKIRHSEIENTIPAKPPVK